MKTILDIQNISYKYPDGYKALQDISFTVNEGEKIGLIGTNGAGKSTILQLIVGLLDIQDGNISVDGIILNKKSLKKIRELIGFIFQDSDNQLFMNTVYDDIAFGLRNKGLDEEKINLKVNTILDKINIKNLKDRQIYKLSGGEKKSVSIAGVLVMEPKIIVMDEPTAALDQKSRRNFINIINSLEQTCIIVTHDLDMILDCCKKVVILNDGKIIHMGEAEQVLKDKELLENCNLELPLCYQRYNT